MYHTQFHFISSSLFSVYGTNNIFNFPWNFHCLSKKSTNKIIINILYLIILIWSENKQSNTPTTIKLKFYTNFSAGGKFYICTCGWRTERWMTKGADFFFLYIKQIRRYKILNFFHYDVSFFFEAVVCLLFFSGMS